MKLVPKRRFKGFSEFWEKHQIKDTCEIHGRIGFRGYTRNDIITKEYGGILAFSPINIKDSTLDLSVKNTYITLTKYEESPEIKIHNGDILFVKTGSTLGKSTLIKTLGERATINPQIVVIRTAVVNRQFIATLLQATNILRQVARSKIGGAVPTLTESQIQSFQFFMPKSESEVIRIGDFFAEIDNFISTEQKMLIKLQTMKQAYLHEMFPAEGESVPKRRFAGFTEKWQPQKLAEIAEIVGGGTPSTSNPKYWNGDIDWYSPTEIGKQTYADGSIKTITQLGLKKSSANILPANRTILFTSRASIGDMAILRRPGTTNQGFQSIVLRTGIDTYFVYSMGHILKPEALKKASGSTFLEVSGQNLSKIKILIPSAEEQHKIGTFFRKLDERIAMQEAKVKKLKATQKAYLEEMFI